MPALVNTVLADRATPTPVNHTFVKRDVTRDGVGTVVETSGVPIGNNSLSVGLRRTPSGRYIATVHLACPVVQDVTIGGVTSPQVVRRAFAKCEFTFDEKSTEQERKNIVGMFASALDPSKVLVNDTVVLLQGVY